jgi:hypothetical protein
VERGGGAAEPKKPEQVGNPQTAKVIRVPIPAGGLVARADRRAHQGELPRGPRDEHLPRGHLRPHLQPPPGAAQPQAHRPAAAAQVTPKAHPGNEKTQGGASRTGWASSAGPRSSSIARRQATGRAT